MIIRREKLFGLHGKNGSPGSSPPADPVQQRRGRRGPGPFLRWRTPHPPGGGSGLVGSQRAASSACLRTPSPHRTPFAEGISKDMVRGRGHPSAFFSSQQLFFDSRGQTPPLGESLSKAPARTSTPSRSAPLTTCVSFPPHGMDWTGRLRSRVTYINPVSYPPNDLRTKAIGTPSPLGPSGLAALRFLVWISRAAGLFGGVVLLPGFRLAMILTGGREGSEGFFLGLEVLESAFSPVRQSVPHNLFFFSNREFFT